MGCPKLHEGWRFVSAETADVEKSPFLFSPEYLDSETNLVYYNYRYYSPELGRWMSRDPIGIKGGLNVYAMTENNPISFFDRLGLWTKSLWSGDARGPYKGTACAESGDTLWKLARSITGHGIDWKTLGISSKIKIGQTVDISLIIRLLE